MHNFSESDKTYSAPTSQLFPEESGFRNHVAALIEETGYESSIERGVDYGDIAFRWDIGVTSSPSPFCTVELIVECKVKAGAPNLQRALGQAILYREYRCAAHLILCFPSDLPLPALFESVCERFKIWVATEKDIAQKIARLLKPLGRTDATQPKALTPAPAHEQAHLHRGSPTESH